MHFREHVTPTFQNKEEFPALPMHQAVSGPDVMFLGIG
jgi:hypothetical protein